jgi:hypothetical protein
MMEIHVWPFYLPITALIEKMAIPANGESHPLLPLR